MFLERPGGNGVNSPNASRSKSLNSSTPSTIIEFCLKLEVLFLASALAYSAIFLMLTLRFLCCRVFLRIRLRACSEMKGKSVLYSTAKTFFVKSLIGPGLIFLISLLHS